MYRIAEFARSVSATARTLVFMLKVLPMLPSRPLNLVTKRPVIERVAYPSPLGQVEADLYIPGGPGPHPGAVICLGVVPFGIDHPQVPRLGEALARAGVAALLYWSPAMRDLRLDPVDIYGIAEAYAWLIDRPSIEARRSGLIGTCVGGSFALMAAAQPAIRDRVGFVAAWAPYADMRSFARDISSASAMRNGVRSHWEVDQLTRKVYVRSLTSTLDAAEAEQLRSQCAERAGSMVPPGLSREGAALYPLLTALDDRAASGFIDALPDSIQRRLDQLSPLSYTDQIRTPTILLAHDRDDNVIPISQSRELCTAFHDPSRVRYTEFIMFKHLDPTKVRLPIRALTSELVRFVRAMYPIFRETGSGTNQLQRRTDSSESALDQISETGAAR